MRLAPALAAVVALALGATLPAAHVLSQGGVTIAIDVDITGNDARTVGTVDNCARIDSSGANELQIDVVVPDPGIPADLGIKAYQFDLLYDENVVTVTGEDQEFLLAQAPDSELFTGLSDALPDTDGRFTSAAFDWGRAYEVEPKGVQEVGPGIITRITLTAVAQGTTVLSLDKVKLLDWAGNVMPLSSVFSAAVSVDMPCEPPPSPTPPPGAPSPTAPAAETPSPATPSPGASPTDSETPGMSTPAPGTPVLGGTPVSEGEGAAGGEAPAAGETDGGLSSAAWAGIGVGVAAAVLAASGAGWFALRRRRPSSE